MSVLSLSSIPFWIFYLLTTLLSLATSLNSSRLKALNPYSKKMVFLFLFSIYYISGKTVFQDLHTLISTALPIATMYLIDVLVGDVRVIGVTGGIACGKSTLVNYIKQNYEIKIIDCDEISKKQRLPGGPAYNYIVREFGEGFVDPVTRVIRNDKLGEEVFKDKQKLKKLTRGTVKYILFELVSQLVKSILSNNKLVLIDAPTLYESKVLEYFLHPIIVVWVDEEEQIRRL